MQLPCVESTGLIVFIAYLRVMRVGEGVQMVLLYVTAGGPTRILRQNKLAQSCFCRPSVENMGRNEALCRVLLCNL